VVHVIPNTASVLAVRNKSVRCTLMVEQHCAYTLQQITTLAHILSSPLLSSPVSRTMARAVSVRPQTTETRLDTIGHVAFVVGKLALGQVYLRFYRSTPVSPFRNSSAPHRCMTAGKQHK